MNSEISSNSPPPTFLMEYQKTYLVKVNQISQKSRNGQHWPYLGPLEAILEFPGDVAMQAVTE